MAQSTIPSFSQESRRFKEKYNDMILETKRLIIREYTLKDFDALYEIFSDAETMKYYPKPYDENGVRRWIDWCIGSYKQNGFAGFLNIIVLLKSKNREKILEIYCHCCYDSCNGSVYRLR